MKTLVLGAGGFVGRRVVARLTDQAGPEEVIAVMRHVDPSSSDSRTRAVACDLADGDAVEDLFRRERPTHLVHLAWNAVPGAFWTSPDNLAHVEWALHAVRCFARHGGVRVVGIGSCAEYDWTGDGILDETRTPLIPATLYGVAKASLGNLLLAGAPALGLSAAWGRLVWLYGPGEKPGRLVSDLIAALMAGKPFICGPGHQRRDYIHVDDVADAIVLAVGGNYHGAFNIGSGTAIPVRTIVETTAALLGRSDLLRIGARPATPGEPPLLVAATTILREAIGFGSCRSLEEGLTATCAAAR